jgi:hypothetical protein
MPRAVCAHQRHDSVLTVYGMGAIVQVLLPSGVRLREMIYVDERSASTVSSIRIINISSDISKVAILTLINTETGQESKLLISIW